MHAVKTAISIEKKLFDQAEALALALKVSRSRLFVLALQDFIEHQNSRELMARLNAAYADDESDVAETALRRTSRRQHRRMVEGEW